MNTFTRGVALLFWGKRIYFLNGACPRVLASGMHNLPFTNAAQPKQCPLPRATLA